MTSYIYQVTCPSCDKVYQIARDEPYARPRLHRLCGMCRGKRDEEAEFQGVEDCGSLRSQKGCFNCKHFVPMIDGKGWGKCALGHVYDSERPNEYDEPLGLVYSLDSCSDWEAEEEDGKD